LFVSSYKFIFSCRWNLNGNDHFFGSQTCLNDKLISYHSTFNIQHSIFTIQSKVLKLLTSTDLSIVDNEVIINTKCSRFLACWCNSDCGSLCYKHFK
jgi:hypothetical protein